MNTVRTPQEELARSNPLRSSRVRATAVLSALLLGCAVLLNGAGSGPAAAAPEDVKGAARLINVFPSEGTGLSWSIALVVYDQGPTGATVGETTALAARRTRAILQYQEQVLEATDGRFGVRLDVYSQPVWTGTRDPRVVEAAQYDVVAHMYPKFADDPLPTDIGVTYMGLAGRELDGTFYHEYPFNVDASMTFSGDLLWHETLHTATQYLLARGMITPSMLPHDDVHGRPASYPSEKTYFRDYVRGQVTTPGGASLGLGVGRLTSAGPIRLWVSRSNA